MSDKRFKLLTVEDITDLTTTDDMSYSLKVYVAACSIGMQEYTGSPDSIEAQGLLEI